MPAPLWPRLTRLQRISHLYLHLADQGHIILLISPNNIIICFQSSEINVGKLANPIFMRPNRAKSKFQLITPRGQLGSSWTVQLVPNFPFRSDILHNYHCFHIRPGGLIMKGHLLSQNPLFWVFVPQHHPIHLLCKSSLVSWVKLYKVFQTLVLRICQNLLLQISPLKIYAKIYFFDS